MASDKRMLLTSYSTIYRTASVAKSFLAQNVSGAELEKLLHPSLPQVFKMSG